MLRWFGERRRWLTAALVALALLVGTLAWVGSRAPARIAAMISSRLGVDASIEDTELSLGSFVLRGVELTGRAGGLDVRIERVELGLSFVAALFRGAAAVRSVSARTVDVQMDLRDEGLTGSLAAIRERVAARPSEGATGTHSVGGRVYELSGVSVHVIDREGDLFTIRDSSLTKNADDLRCASIDALFGDRTGDYASFGPTSVDLRRVDGDWLLHAIEIENADIRALRNGESEAHPLALRLRDALALLRGSDADPVPSEQAANPASERDAAVGEEPAGTSGPSDIPGAPTRLFARLTPDADLSVSNVRIESRTTNEGRVERIQDLELDVDGAGDGWYRIVVGGETPRGGSLLADLSLMPSEARAEGRIEVRGISLALVEPFVPEVPFYDSEAGTVSAKLELDAESVDRVRIDGGFRVEELAVFDERISADPVEHINISVRGKGDWLPKLRRLEIASAQVRMNEALVLIEGELERTRDHYLVDLVAKLPPTPCNDVVSAIPNDVLGSLSSFEWSGNWSALARISLDSRDLEAAELSIKVRNLCTFERAPPWVRVERFREPFRHRVIEPDDTVFEMVTGPGSPSWVALSDISPFVVAAVISHEDGGFYEHGGFAPWAIRDALVRNLQEGRYVVGASTISMQLAKNLYLQRDKTLSRKAQEVILTWWLENALTKEEILELYLNVIEYGPGVYGLRNAAAYYFDRPPSELSPAESAYLACMLPSPKRYHVSYERNQLTRSMKGRSRRLLEHMAKRERIGPEALAYGLSELEDFHFYHEGDPPPPPRTLPPLGAPEEPAPNDLDPYEALFVDP